MTDQPLREALEEHLARRYWEHGMGGRWERPADAPDAPFPAYATDQEKKQCRSYVRELLKGFEFAAHPAEPAPTGEHWPCGCHWDSEDGPVACASHKAFPQPPQPAPVGVEITDEAVHRVSEAIFQARNGFAPTDGTQRLLYGNEALAALEAARPFMTSRPALDPEQLAVALRAHTLFPADEVEPPTCKCGWIPSSDVLRYSEHAQHVRDAVMALVVPVPTREAVIKALGSVDGVQNLQQTGDLLARANEVLYGKAADAVLALLNGSAK